MHETVAAQSILNTILGQAEKYNARPVGAIVSCGTFNAINDELLSFAFTAAAVGTVCEGMNIAVKHIPLKGRCKNCGSQFDFDIHSPNCPACGNQTVEILPDAQLLLEEIEFEDGL